MTIYERKKMIVNAIRELEDQLCAYRYYDGILTLPERDEKIDMLQRHLRCAHSVLLLITEEELEMAS